MEDHVLEYSIPQKSKFPDYVLPATFFALAGASFTLFFTYRPALFLIPPLVYLGLRYYDKLYTEVDVLFINGSLTLDYIYRKKRRATGTVIERGMIRKIAPYPSENLRGKKGEDYSSREHPENSWVIYYDSPRGPKYAIIEERKNLLELLKKYVPRSF